MKGATIHLLSQSLNVTLNGPQCDFFSFLVNFSLSIAFFLLTFPIPTFWTLSKVLGTLSFTKTSKFSQTSLPSQRLSKTKIKLTGENRVRLSQTHTNPVHSNSQFPKSTHYNRPLCVYLFPPPHTLDNFVLLFSLRTHKFFIISLVGECGKNFHTERKTFFT